MLCLKSIWMPEINFRWMFSIFNGKLTVKLALKVHQNVCEIERKKHFVSANWSYVNSFISLESKLNFLNPRKLFGTLTIINLLSNWDIAAKFTRFPFSWWIHCPRFAGLINCSRILQGGRIMDLRLCFDALLLNSDWSRFTKMDFLFILFILNASTEIVDWKQRGESSREFQSKYLLFMFLKPILLLKSNHHRWCKLRVCYKRLELKIIIFLHFFEWKTMMRRNDAIYGCVKEKIWNSNQHRKSSTSFHVNTVKFHDPIPWEAKKFILKKFIH